MRMSDYYLNATEICAAAGLSKSERARYRRLLQKRGVLDRESSWVPFQDGVFLSEAVNLIDDLKPLFTHAPIDLPEQGNYLLQGWTQLPPGYEFLEYGGISIAYMPSARVVNAAHLLRLATRRHNLRGFLSRNPQVRAEIHGGPRNIKGTYISFEDAVLLCQHFDLNSSPIDQLLGVSEPVIIEHNRHGEVRNTDDDQEAFEGSPNLPCISADDGDVYSSAADGHWPSPPTSRRHSVRYQSASSCHPESQSDTEYDNDCWLDPLHQLGGGSSLAKWGQPSGDPSGITQSFTPLDWMGAESDMPRTDPPQCSPAGGGDLRSPADGSESANDANVDRPADLPVHQQSITPLVGEQKECLQSSGEAALVGPARVDPPTAFRARKKTSPEDQAFLKAEYHRNSKPSKRSYHRIVQTVSMNEKQVQVYYPGLLSHLSMSNSGFYALRSGFKIAGNRIGSEWTRRDTKSGRFAATIRSKRDLNDKTDAINTKTAQRVGSRQDPEVLAPGDISRRQGIGCRPDGQREQL
ncbi:hypothetical protein GE09DRAFT_1141598 [Coniochaeta sp. 2T2.1]|nr:hypothetical protein GE09DRAFT_1141598 [Coniochaeta sp. 2T2.1]